MATPRKTIWKCRVPAPLLWVLAALISSNEVAAKPAPVDEAGQISVPAFELPVSSLHSIETRKALATEQAYLNSLEKAQAPCTALRTQTSWQSYRACSANRLYSTSLYTKVRKRFPVVITSGKIGGVPVEIFEPTEGVAEKNASRVLINLHMGAFVAQSRFHMEAAPISSLGRFKVIAVDYRMAPDFRFPAASEDVAAVYRELLETYKPANIGIYGCSAGALLTAQSIAWFQKEKLPTPGAIGMFGGAATYWTEGDSGRLMSAIYGVKVEPVEQNPYLGPGSAINPLAIPLLSDSVMARFPPSLLISSTRDLSLSSVIKTHSTLVRMGVDADLHVWEGMNHCFAASGSEAPEADEANRVVVRFFDQRLGR